MTLARAADVVFDEATHRYTRGGRALPHPTGVLRATGVSIDVERLPEPVQAVALRKRELGRLVHRACQFDAERDLDVAQLDPRLWPYVEAARLAVWERGATLVAAEVIVYHPVYDYSGTIDAIIRLPDVDGIVIVDWSVGDPWAAAKQYQTAAYADALEAAGGEPVADRWAVWLQPERRPPYTLSLYRNPTDRATWRSILATYRVQAERRSRR